MSIIPPPEPEAEAATRRVTAPFFFCVLGALTAACAGVWANSNSANFAPCSHGPGWGSAEGNEGGAPEDAATWGVGWLAKFAGAGAALVTALVLTFPALSAALTTKTVGLS